MIRRQFVYEGVAYKNERQKISISVEKKDAVTEEKLEGVIFGLYAKEDILSQQGEVLVEKDTPFQLLFCDCILLFYRNGNLLSLIFISNPFINNCLRIIL